MDCSYFNTLVVNNLEKSIEFYNEIGFNSICDKTINKCKIKLSKDFSIELFEYKHYSKQMKGPFVKNKSNNKILNLEMSNADEVDILFLNAKNAGATIHQNPMWRDWGGYTAYTGYFYDIDGYEWEVSYCPLKNKIKKSL